MTLRFENDLFYPDFHSSKSHPSNEKGCPGENFGRSLSSDPVSYGRQLWGSRFFPHSIDPSE